MWYCLYMESKKGQKWTYLKKANSHKCGKQIYGYQEGSWAGRLGVTCTGLLYIELITSKDLLWVSQAALVVKSPAANAGDAEGTVLWLGQEQPLEEGVATLSSILTWRIPEAAEGWAPRATGEAQSWTRLKGQRTQARTWWVAEGTLPSALEWPYIYIWENNFKKCGYMYAYNWSTLLLKLT